MRKRKIGLDILNESRRMLVLEKLTEIEVCKELKVSETSLRNLYKRHLNTTPKIYIRNVKMCKVRTLLRITNLSVSELADMVGYVNVSKMSAAFKEKYSISPSQYRKTVRDC